MKKLIVSLFGIALLLFSFRLFCRSACDDDDVWYKYTDVFPPTLSQENGVLQMKEARLDISVKNQPFFMEGPYSQLSAQYSIENASSEPVSAQMILPVSYTMKDFIQAEDQFHIQIDGKETDWEAYPVASEYAYHEKMGGRQNITQELWEQTKDQTASIQNVDPDAQGTMCVISVSAIPYRNIKRFALTVIVPDDVFLPARQNQMFSHGFDRIEKNAEGVKYEAVIPTTVYQPGDEAQNVQKYAVFVPAVLEDASLFTIQIDGSLLKEDDNLSEDPDAAVLVKDAVSIERKNAPFSEFVNAYLQYGLHTENLEKKILRGTLQQIALNLNGDAPRDIAAGSTTAEHCYDLEELLYTTGSNREKSVLFLIFSVDVAAQSSCRLKTSYPIRGEALPYSYTYQIDLQTLKDWSRFQETDFTVDVHTAFTMPALLNANTSFKPAGFGQYRAVLDMKRLPEENAVIFRVGKPYTTLCALFFLGACFLNACLIKTAVRSFGNSRK